MDPRILYCAPFFGAALFIFVVALFALRRRKSRGGWYLVFICLTAALWAGTEGMLFWGMDAGTNLFITYIQYLGIAPLALLFALTIFGFDAWVTPKRMATLLGIAGVIVLLVWTNSLHHLVYGKIIDIEKSAPNTLR